MSHPTHDQLLICPRCQQPNLPTFERCRHCSAPLLDPWGSPGLTGWAMRAVATTVSWLGRAVEDLMAWHRLARLRRQVTALRAERQTMLPATGGQALPVESLPPDVQARVAQIHLDIVRIETEIEELSRQCHPATPTVLFLLIALGFLLGIGFGRQAGPRLPGVATRLPTQIDLGREPTRVRWLLHEYRQVKSLAFLQSGQLLVGGDGGLRQLDLGRRQLSRPWPGPTDPFVHQVVVVGKRILTASYEGVHSLEPARDGRSTGTLEPMLHDVLARCLLPLRRELWIGTVDQGCYRFNRRAIGPEATGLGPPVLALVAGPHGIHAATERGVFSFLGEVWQPVPIHGLPSNGGEITAMITDPDGLLVGTGWGLFRGVAIDEQQWQWWPVNLTEPQRIRCLTALGPAVIVGAETGLFVFESGRFRALPVDRPVSAIAAAGSRLAVGIPGGIELLDFADDGRPGPALAGRSSGGGEPDFRYPAAGESPGTGSSAGSAASGATALTPGPWLPPQLASATVHHLVAASDSLWLDAAQLGWWQRTRHTGWTPVPAIPAGTRIERVRPMPGGGLLVMTNAAWWTLDAGHRLVAVASVPETLDLAAEPDGSLWRLCPAGSITRRPPGRTTFTHVATCPVALDPSSCRWLDAADRLLLFGRVGIAERPGASATVLIPWQANDRPVAATTRRHGTIVIAMDDGRVLELRGANLMPLARLADPPTGLQDDGDTLWAWSEQDLFRFDGRDFRRVLEISSGRILGIVPIMEGGVSIVGTTHGLRLLPKMP